MSSRTKDMTQGYPTKLILQFSLSLLAGNVLQQMYNLVDTFAVGLREVILSNAMHLSAFLDRAVNILFDDELYRDELMRLFVRLKDQ